ncbi:hypothetical protein GJ744_008579 [Endocarpon pusillum]|uniref:Uncharacterized protein n=1 Tax=Endocarpon pusillum TaxID=364733 RepID=A0A8H7E535_9EURO|nr:hypothetical protein GJ744_008579 [Endocarpon pusillum]
MATWRSIINSILCVHNGCDSLNSFIEYSVKPSTELRVYPLPTHSLRATRPRRNTYLPFHPPHSYPIPLLPTPPYPRAPSQPNQPYLSTLLDLIDITRWAGHSISVRFITGQLRSLSEHTSARACLKGPATLSSSEPEAEEPSWLTSVPASSFEPPLNPNLSLHFTIQHASLVPTMRTPSRTTESPSSSFSLLDRLFRLGHKMLTHDEMGEVFHVAREGGSQRAREGKGSRAGIRV